MEHNDMMRLFLNFSKTVTTCWKLFETASAGSFQGDRNPTVISRGGTLSANPVPVALQPHTPRALERDNHTTCLLAYTSARISDTCPTRLSQHSTTLG